MLVGFGETLVTPPLGLEMAGYFSNRLADGVLDDLYSRARSSPKASATPPWSSPI